MSVAVRTSHAVHEQKLIQPFPQPSPSEWTKACHKKHSLCKQRTNLSVPHLFPLGNQKDVMEQVGSKTTACILWVGWGIKMGEVGKQRTEGREGEIALSFFAFLLFPLPISPCSRLCQIPLRLFSSPLPNLISLQSFGFKYTHIYMQLNAGFDFSPGKLEG